MIWFGTLMLTMVVAMTNSDAAAPIGDLLATKSALILLGTVKLLTNVP